MSALVINGDTVLSMNVPTRSLSHAPSVMNVTENMASIISMKSGIARYLFARTRSIMSLTVLSAAARFFLSDIDTACSM